MQVDFPILTKLQVDKYKHEEKAKDRLVDKITSPITKKIFSQGGFSNEHRIIVFGHSGVGKTTLILLLLGVKTQKEDDEFNIVNLGKAIRGNTKPGGAGTATVFRYKISKNGKGTIQISKDDIRYFKKLNELTQILNEIRGKVENKNWKNLDPVEVIIPKQYFIRKDNKSIPWVITDLPGINSNTPEEHEHVSELIKAYIHHSNVLLILEQASQLRSLSSLRIPDIGLWNYYGRRCRLIVTRSMSEGTVKTKLIDKLEDKRELNADELIKDYEEELKNEEICIEGISGVFPLDYGDSWNTLRETEPTLFSKVEKAIEGVKEKLIISLEDSLRPEEEFLAIMDIENLQVKVTEDIEKNKKHISELENKITKVNEKLNFTASEIIKYVNKISMIKSTIGVWNKRNENEFKNPWGNAHGKEFSRNNSNEHDDQWIGFRHDFRKSIKEYSNHIFDDTEKLDELFRNNYEDNFPPFASNWRDPKFCSDYSDWEGSYLFSKWDKIKDWFITTEKEIASKVHKKAIKKGVETEYTFWTHKINNIINKEISRIIKKKKNKKKKKKKIVIVLEGDCTKNEEKKKKLVEKKEEFQNEVKRIKKTNNADIDMIFRSYKNIRDEELTSSIKYFINIAEKSSPQDRLQYLAFCNQIFQLSKTISQT